MTEAWFRWERSLGKWRPVVIYGEKPRAPKGEEHRYTTPQRVPDDCLSGDGSPMFGKLRERFHVPGEAA